MESARVAERLMAAAAVVAVHKEPEVAVAAVCRHWGLAA